MARMSIDDKVCRDPRITMLAASLGWSRRETVGCLILEVWPICYDQESALISERVIDTAAARDGFAQAMIETELASRDRSGKIRIHGAKERIEYLNHKRKAGHEGGLKSAESRAKTLKQRGKHTSSSGGSTPQAAGNPSVPDLPSASASALPPDLDLKNSAPPSAGASLPAQPVLDKIQEHLGDLGVQRALGGRKRKPKPSDPSPPEIASALTILEKLSAQNGVRYSGTEQHIGLIVARLRDGISEMDMRAVIGFCALELNGGWKNKADMIQYLRPETLFGPQTISKYLDPARTWFEKLNGDAPAQIAAGQQLALEGGDE